MASKKFSYQTLLQTLEQESVKPLSKRVRETLHLAYEGHRRLFRDARTSGARVPFIVHPVGTARLAIKYFPIVEDKLADGFETVVCVALAHDLLEDTETDPSQLEEIAGPEVRLAVEALTKPPAGVIGITKDARNREFVNQIIEAGPTAVYVKMCDSIHNMSRPNITPPQLYRKVVEKAQKLYLPLLSRCSLGDEFEKIYRDSLSKAEQDAIKEEKFAKETPVPKRLDEAVSECVTESAGKVLELHDITEILNRICGTLNTSIWRVGGRDSDTLSIVSTSDANFWEKDSFQIVIVDSPAVITGKASRKFPIHREPEQDSTILLIPMQIGPERSFVVMLVFDVKDQPKWLTRDVAALFVQYLAHRLIVSESGRRARVATEAAKLGIQIDAELAAESGIMPTDLLPLNHWRIRCSQAIGIIRSLLDFYLLSDVTYDPLRQLIRVESRVKAINSILRKMTSRAKRAILRYDQIEDIAGIRVICPTLADINRIRDFLKCQKAVAAGCRLHPSIKNPERDFVNSPTVDGYRAIHLVLEVDTYLKDGGFHPVPCEVQLRTMFQDIWATIAHDTLYTTSTKSDSLKASLQQMGKALKDCEELAERIVKEQK